VPRAEIKLPGDLLKSATGHGGTTDSIRISAQLGEVVRLAAIVLAHPGAHKPRHLGSFARVKPDGMQFLSPHPVEHLPVNRHQRPHIR
jgi:hypothetical protein